MNQYAITDSTDDEIYFVNANGVPRGSADTFNLGAGNPQGLVFMLPRACTRWWITALMKSILSIYVARSWSSLIQQCGR